MDEINARLGKVSDFQEEQNVSCIQDVLSKGIED